MIAITLFFVATAIANVFENAFNEIIKELDKDLITRNSTAVSDGGKRQACAVDCATAMCSPCTKKTVADFIINIDCSSSMETSIRAVAAGMQTFVTAIGQRNIQAYYMLILYGVFPEVVVDWVTDPLIMKHVIGGVNAGGGCEGCREPDVFHFNHDCPGCATQEAPFEVINMVLQKHKNNIMKKHPKNKYAPGADSVVTFHPDSRKFFINLSDEDADCPTYKENRQLTPSGQVPNCFEPPEMFPQQLSGQDSDIWIKEIDFTVTNVIAADLSAHFFCNPGDKPSINQISDPTLQVQNGDYSNFDEKATLTKLLASTTSRYGFQAKAIQARQKDPSKVATFRVFDVANVALNNGKNIENFFTRVVEAVDDGCYMKKRAEPPALPCNRFDCDCMLGCTKTAICNAGCDQCNIGGVCYNNFEKNPRNACEQCLTSKSNTTWSGCDDLNECTTDVCRSGQCAYDLVCTAKCNLCMIDGKCIPNKSFKENDPSGPDCYQCLPQCDATKWVGSGFCKNVPAGCGAATPAPPPATCDDIVQNQGELGVDCGGPCPKPCSSGSTTCTDGIKNGDETGVDCGGSKCSACDGTCFDSIKQASEQCTDCGGRCTALCTSAACGTIVDSTTGSCTDGIQNVGELGVDCGGRCSKACTDANPTVNCNDGKQGPGELGIDCGGSCPKACGAIAGGGVLCTLTAQFIECQNRCAGTEVAKCYCSAGDSVSSVECKMPTTAAGTTECNQIEQFNQCKSMCGGANPVKCLCLNNAVTSANCGDCFDKLKNNGETGIDCGGTCPACTSDNQVTSCSSAQTDICVNICSPNKVTECQCTAKTANAVCGQAGGGGSDASTTILSLTTLFVVLLLVIVVVA